MIFKLFATQLLEPLFFFILYSVFFSFSPNFCLSLGISSILVCKTSGGFPWLCVRDTCLAEEYASFLLQVLIHHFLLNPQFLNSLLVPDVANHQHNVASLV